MAFLDRFKGEKKNEEKKKTPKAKKASVTEEKTVDTSVKSEEKVVAKTKTSSSSAKTSVTKVAPPKDSTAYRVLVRPLVSEKTARLEKNRQFTFAVTPDANKVEIKKAVEKHYRVHVTNVNVVNVTGKFVRSGRTIGKRKDWRKAYVTVREGENITF